MAPAVLRCVNVMHFSIDPKVNVMHCLPTAGDEHRQRWEMEMTAYIHKSRDGYQLTICARPCNGEEFHNGEKITVKGLREARKVCAERGAEPRNF